MLTAPQEHKNILVNIHTSFEEILDLTGEAYFSYIKINVSGSRDGLSAQQEFSTGDRSDF